MGLISGALSLGARLLGGAAPAITGPAAGAAGGGLLSTLGGIVTSPLGGGLIGGGIGGGLVEAISGLFGGGAQAAPPGGMFGGGGGVTVLPGSPLGQIMAAGTPTTSLVGGRFLATAPNGDVQVFNRHGFPVRPSEIIPAGQRLPGGATVVSIRQGGQLIGVTKRRRRRTFAGEIQRTRRVLAGCRAIERACAPPKRRSAHR